MFEKDIRRQRTKTLGWDVPGSPAYVERHLGETSQDPYPTRRVVH